VGLEPTTRGLRDTILAFWRPVLAGRTEYGDLPSPVSVWPGCCHRCCQQTPWSVAVIRHPVAQVSPDRAALAWSRWSAPPDVRPGPGERGLVASGARWVTVHGWASRRRLGPGAEPRPPEAVSGS